MCEIVKKLPELPTINKNNYTVLAELHVQLVKVLDAAYEAAVASGFDPDSNCVRKHLIQAIAAVREQLNRFEE